jgi:hypothetical protein
MHIRFRKTLNVLPGVRLNISRHGLSTSVGPRGAHLTFSRYGVRQSVGLPGSGLSETGYIMGGNRNAQGGNREAQDDAAARYHASIHHGEGLGCHLPGCGCLLLALVILGAAAYFGASALNMHPATFISGLLAPLWHSLLQLFKNAGK